MIHFKKRTVKSCVILVILLAFIVLTYTISFAAVKGDLTFTHGVDPSQKITYAITSSTQVESNMFFNGCVIHMSGPYNGQTFCSSKSPTYNVSYDRYDLTPGSIKGASFFDYGVDSYIVHSSTAWFNFDFR